MSTKNSVATHPLSFPPWLVLVGLCILGISRLANAQGVFQLDRVANERAAQGKTALDRISRDMETSKPVHSLCWRQAVENLVGGCKSMDDSKRSKFAMQLSNCHLERSGLPVPPCTADMELVECTRPILNNPIAFNAYTEFLLHSESICYFIQSIYFQEKTEKTISSLAFAASATLESMEGLEHLSNSMHLILADSVQVQSELFSSQNALRETMSNLRQDQLENMHLLQLHLGQLHQLSGNIQEGVEETIQSQQAFRERQEALLEQQQLMQREGLEFFQVLSGDSAYVREQMQLSTEAQSQLLEDQKIVMDRVKIIKESQLQLEESQKDFFEKQRQLQEQSKKQLLEIITDSNMASQHLQQLVQGQTSAFQSAVTKIGDLATRSESTIASIHDQHIKISNLQNELLGRVERVAEFQKAILGESFDLNSVMFYVVFLLVTFVVTSLSLTRSARWRIVIVLMTNVLFEKLIRINHLHIIPWEDDYSSVILIRWLCATLAAAILLMSAIRHRDFLRENNQLLRDLTEKNVQILGHLQQQEVLWSMQLRELERQKSKQVSILHEGQ